MIGSDVVGPTAVDKTAGTETQIGIDLVLPAWARAILAIRPMTAHATPTDDQPVMHRLSLRSDDFSVQPYEVLCAPTGSIIGTGSSQAPEAPWYPVNCPVNGGDRLKVYGTGLSTIAADAFMMAQIVVSDKKPGSQLHGRCADVMTTSLGAGIYAPETPYTLTGGNTLKELVGFAGCIAAATVEGMMGFFEWRSNDFGAATPLKIPTNPMAGAITDGGVTTNGVARAKVDLPIRSPCQITGSMTLADIPTAGKFITGVLYT